MTKKKQAKKTVKKTTKKTTKKTAKKPAKKATKKTASKPVAAKKQSPKKMAQSSVVQQLEEKLKKKTNEVTQLMKERDEALEQIASMNGQIDTAIDNAYDNLAATHMITKGAAGQIMLVGPQLQFDRGFILVHAVSKEKSLYEAAMLIEDTHTQKKSTDAISEAYNQPDKLEGYHRRVCEILHGQLCNAASTEGAQ